ncbi:hypothetical protein BKA70DRAFT_1290982, partial [Coprinopsis sp. MPI-PUGE-AT-0042]
INVPRNVPKLPNELLGAVVDCLRDTSDWAAIQTLSIASPDLQLICQRLLFENLSLILVTDGDAATGYRLGGLAKTPRLLSYVRSFKLQLQEPPHGDRVAWVTKHGDLLVQVLKLLPLDQIETLCLVDWQRIYLGHTYQERESQIQFIEIRDRLQEAFQLLLEAPFIRSLSVTNHSMGKFQACGPSLKHLFVDGTVARNVAVLSLSTHTLTPTIMLETLESRNNTCNVTRLMGPSFLSFHQYLLHPSTLFSLQYLKRLVWRNYDNEFEELRLVMASCARSLLHLDLLIDTIALNTELSNGPTALIWAQDRLEHLVIHAYIYSWGVDPLLWLHHELGRRESPYKQLGTIS